LAPRTCAEGRVITVPAATILLMKSRRVIAPMMDLLVYAT
jgi:hypothetical protein